MGLSPPVLRLDLIMNLSDGAALVEDHVLQPRPPAPPPSNYSMRLLLGALGLATALPLLVLAVVMYQQMLANERQAVRQSLMGSAEALSSLVDNEIDTHIAIASALAASPALESGDLSSTTACVAR